jgi:hypothetical protein
VGLVGGVCVCGGGGGGVGGCAGVCEREYFYAYRALQVVDSGKALYTVVTEQVRSCARAAARSQLSAVHTRLQHDLYMKCATDQGIMIRLRPAANTGHICIGTPPRPPNPSPDFWRKEQTLRPLRGTPWYAAPLSPPPRSKAVLHHLLCGVPHETRPSRSSSLLRGSFRLNRSLDEEVRCLDGPAHPTAPSRTL